MPRGGRFIFDDETAQTMRKKYEGGATLRSLVEEYGTNPNTIANTIRRVGGTLRRQGGPAKPPKLKKQRKPGPIMGIGDQLRKQYESDTQVTVYTLALRYNCSISAIHRSLVAAGTQMRKSGGDYKSRNARGLLSWVNS